MNWLKTYLQPDNLHHAYLLLGGREDVEDLVAVLQEIGIVGVQDPDLSIASHDSFLVEDSWNLRSAQNEHPSVGDKKVFIISAETFTGEAQNALLKILEEPSGSSIFFLIARHPDRLFKTVLSRVVYLKKPDGSDPKHLQEGEKFLLMSVTDRMDQVTKLIKKYKGKGEDEEEESEDETKGKRRASHELKNATNLLLNGIECALASRLKEQKKDEIAESIQQIWKLRDYLFDQGSSAKMILEHVAITMPLTK